MQTVTSKITKKYQATIPKHVRDLLDLHSGDEIAFDIDDVVQLRKATPLDIPFIQSLEGTLSEWSSKADEDAYCDL